VYQPRVLESSLITPHKSGPTFGPFHCHRKLEQSTTKSLKKNGDARYTDNVIQADEPVFELWLNASELSLLHSHLFRRDDRQEQIGMVRISGVKRHFPAENGHRSVVGVVMGHTTGAAGRVMELLGEA
jgi:hypothetical protein